MPTVYEVDVAASNQGKAHHNIFHIFDGNDNAVLPDVLDYFETKYCVGLQIILSNQFTFNNIAVKSLTAVNPGTAARTVSITGISAVDAMPTGVHIHIKLVSADQSFKSGAKMLGGGVEDSFVGGNPTAAYLDIIQSRFDDLIADMNPDIGTNLAIYRPTLSLPGIPQVSIVDSALVRGDSTNNRRHLAFERG